MGFSEIMIAPCGVNCGVCIAYLRSKNKCCGCLSPGTNKPAHCSKCAFKNCLEHEKSQFTYCHECPKFPCARLKRLDKRYTEKYHCSPIANLKWVGRDGMGEFLRAQAAKWTCRQCGEILSVHRNGCINCGSPRPDLANPL